MFVFPYLAHLNFYTFLSNHAARDAQFLINFHVFYAPLVWQMSPLAVKPSPKPSSMEQQKALAAALGHQTVATGCLKLDVDAVPKFGGLPEFDETQIPELAPLSAEMEGEHLNDSNENVFSPKIS